MGISDWYHQSRADGDGDGGDTMVTGSSSTNKIQPFMFKLLELEEQNPAVFWTTMGGVTGAGAGGVIGLSPAFSNLQTRFHDLGTGAPKLTKSLVCARNLSAICAVHFGVYSIMRGIRGKDDLTTNLVAGSAGGLAFSFLKKGLVRQSVHSLSHAASFAITSGIVYMVREAIIPRNTEEPFYTEAKAMLSNLGLEEYEKNFKKGHLTDPTLPLLTDSELKEVNIPPGARLLILDHIKRSEANEETSN